MMSGDVIVDQGDSVTDSICYLPLMKCALCLMLSLNPIRCVFPLSPSTDDETESEGESECQ